MHMHIKMCSIILTFNPNPNPKYSINILGDYFKLAMVKLMTSSECGWTCYDIMTP